MISYLTEEDFCDCDRLCSISLLTLITSPVARRRNESILSPEISCIQALGHRGPSHVLMYNLNREVGQ
jgi:hypothetical protein